VAKALDDHLANTRRPSVATDPGKEHLDRVPVLRPLLADADRLLPYLRQIDAARIYTNWGPLASELERRLARHFGLGENCVVSAGSGTAALVSAILGSAGRARPDRPLALIPAFTFVATAIAVEQCGYRPYLVDVSADTWLMEVDQLVGHSCLDQTGLVVAVAPFGRPVAQEACAAFRRRTGIPIVIDAGASFEAVSAEPNRYIGDVPAAMSFHATKSFATGEGGCVVTTDAHLSGLVTRALNFGFFADRMCRSASMNGKMSEYHAAVGLAELDHWPRRRAALLAVADRYRARLDSAGLAARFLGVPDVAGCYALFRCADAGEANRVQRSLTRSNIEFRLWYGGGLLEQPHFHDVPHDPLDVTQRIAPLIVGLPVAADLTETVLERVVTALETSVKEVNRVSDA
jgi:dTDP-4-amino-4,6-dideoxygalactose transaminase